MIRAAHGLNDNSVYLNLMAQVDATDSAPIAVRGAVLVVPQHLAVTGEQLVTNVKSLRIGAGGSTSSVQLNYADIPEWLRNMRVAVNYYLPLVNTTSGKTTWFLFADPAVARPAIEIGFLRGHESPEIFIKESDQRRLGGGTDPMRGSFANDTVEYKVSHVLGGVAMDPKGAVVSNGTGS